MSTDTPRPTTTSTRRASKAWRALAVVGSWAFVLVLWSADTAHADTVRTEAESLLPSSGWTTYTEGATTYAQNTPSGSTVELTYTTPDLQAGATVQVMGYPGGASLEYSLDGGTWTAVSAGTATFTSGALSAGVHTLAVRKGTAGTTYINWFEYVGTVTPPPTSTTTTAPTTTTTAPSGSIEVTPDNTTRQGLGILVLLSTAFFVVKVGQ